MCKARITVALAGLAVLCLVWLLASDGRAGAWTSPGIGDALQHEPIATPVAVWKECKEVAMCTGCKPVYKCRSCSYQRTCAGGLCSWGDVCVWGPYVKVVPRGARIIRQ